MQVLRVRGSERHPVEGKASERIDLDITRRNTPPLSQVSGTLAGPRWFLTGNGAIPSAQLHTFSLIFFSNVGGRRVVTGWVGDV